MKIIKTYDVVKHREWVQSLIKDKANWSIFKEKEREIDEYVENTQKFIDKRCLQLVSSKPQEKWFFEWSISDAKKTKAEWEREKRRFRMYADMSRGKQIQMGIQPEDVKHVPIGEFFSDQGRGTSSRRLFLCPFHNEDTPSFTWYVEQNSWHCYGCSVGGDVIDLVMKLFKLDFKKALIELKKYA